MNIQKCFVQAVEQPVVQPAAECKRTFKWNFIYCLGALATGQRRFLSLKTVF